MHLTKGIFAGLVAALGLLLAVATFSAPAPQKDANAPVYFSAAQVAAAMEKGGVVSESNGKNYRISVNHNHMEKPQVPEIHDAQTHIVIVLDGTGDFVTGDALVDPKPFQQKGQDVKGETRGTALMNPVHHVLVKGDIMTIPHGVPHQLIAADAKGEMTFIMVAVRNEVGD